MTCCSKVVEKEQSSTTCCSKAVDETPTVSVQTKEENSSSCCSSKSEEEADDDSDDSPCCSSEVEESVPTICGTNDNEEGSSCCSNDTEGTKIIEVASSCCSTVTDVSIEEEPIACCGGDAGNDKELSTVPEEKKLEYTVLEMDCPSCASSIEKSVERLQGVSSATVNYNLEKLRIVITDDFSEEELKKTIRNLGFTMEMPTAKDQVRTYDVAGMDCGGCANSIVKHLNNIPGVSDVQVSFATGKMKAVHTNPVEDIIKEVNKIGFEATLPNNSANEKKPRNKSGLYTIALSGILIATGFIGSYLGLPTLIATILYAIALVSSGYKPIKSAYYSLKSRSLDMNVLMSSAAIGAAIIGEWFEGATVVWLFSFGVYLQNRSMDQTRKSIRTLMNLAPSMAWLQVNGELIQKSVDDIAIGQIVIVKPGDKIPLDGKINKGESSINQAPITGESLPVDKGIGETVYAGTINESGSLEIEVTKLVEDTTLAKIIHLVEEAQEQKAPTEAFIDRFASIYTPIVFVLALAVIVLPPLLGFGNWNEWAYKGLALLVVACPCALVISTPVAIVSAIGNAARNGVLIKGGTFLEAAGGIDAIAFDKTGTLTEGKPEVSEVYPSTVSEDVLLSIACTLESHSSHPIAKTLVNYAKDRTIPLVQGDNHRNIVGKGVEATIDGVLYFAGSPRLFKEMNLISKSESKTIQNLEEQGKTIIVIGDEQSVLGIIAVSDTIRPTAAKTLQALKDAGVSETIMLTGDNERVANSIAKQAGVSRYIAELLPEGKVSALKELQNNHLKVAMVGDGINDAPALATSDLGIAMGITGTDTAVETADVILMADNLDKLPYTMKLSRKTMTIIKQNIWFSLIIKVIALALIIPGWLTLWMAVLSDTGAAIIVILNALRLLRVKD